MISPKGFGLSCQGAALIILVAFSGGCGSSGGSHDISQSQAQAISQQVVTTVEAALSAALAPANHGAHSSLSTIVKTARPAQSSDCTPTADGETCNVPVSYTGTCPGGGTIGVSGDFNFTLDNSGDGSDNSTLTITPTNCSVSNLTINGNPDITIGTQLAFQADAPVYPITFTEGGGITYGPNPSGSCMLNVTLTVTSQTSCTVSGTLCGQSLSGSC